VGDDSCAASEGKHTRTKLDGELGSNEERAESARSDDVFSLSSDKKRDQARKKEEKGVGESLEGKSHDELAEGRKEKKSNFPFH